MENILIRMPNWLGDFVMATACLPEVRRHYPDARITVMCKAPFADLVAKDPNVDAVFPVTSSRDKTIIPRLREGRYDLGILLTNSFSSAWHLWRGRVKERIGYTSHFRSLLLTKKIPPPDDYATRHQVLSYLYLLSSYGISISEAPEPYLCITDKDKAAVAAFFSSRGLSSEKRVIGINPGAQYGSAKCWLPERFTTLTQRLLSEDPECSIIYFGDKAGSSLVDTICGEVTSPRVFNMAGKTSLCELIPFIEKCSVFLTNDSGPMHVAAALKTPLVALFGSTSDIRTGPYGGGTVIHKNVPCSPCYKRSCPRDFRCMTSISVDEVFAAVQKTL
jgi:heptosyltransferase II